MDSYRSVNVPEVRDTIYSFTAFLRKCVTFILRAIKEQFLLFLIINALFIGSGVYYYRKQPQLFESQMVCAFNNMHKKTFGEMVHRLNELAVTNSHHQLSATLDITEAQAKTIKGFEAKNIAGSPLHEDITTEKLPLYFTLKATTPEVFPAVQKGLLAYLNSSPYQETRRKLEQEKIALKIAYLDASIQKVDSVIAAYTHFLQRTSAVTDTAAGFSNIAALFSYQEQLQNKKLDEIKMAQLQGSVELVYGFAPPDHPAKKGYEYLMKLAVASLGISILAVGMRKILAYGK